MQSVDDLGRELWGEVLSFQTAPGADTPFAFAVISDTQGNPKVSGRVAQHADDGDIYSMSRLRWLPARLPCAGPAHTPSSTMAALTSAVTVT